MIVYYDILCDKEVGSDSYESTLPSPGVRAIASKKITIAEDEIDIGANAAAGETEEDEGFDKAEAQQVINVVHASHLQKINLTKKEFTTMTKSYFKKIIGHHDQEKTQRRWFR